MKNCGEFSKKNLNDLFLEKTIDITESCNEIRVYGVFYTRGGR